jgi:hypothetical protein
MKCKNRKLHSEKTKRPRNRPQSKVNTPNRKKIRIEMRNISRPTDSIMIDMHKAFIITMTSLLLAQEWPPRAVR